MAEEKKFRFYIVSSAPGGPASAQVSYYNWHNGKHGTATFDDNGEYATNDSGIGEALELLTNDGHPLIRSGPRPAAKKGA
jgi:hypothetical protein